LKSNLIIPLNVFFSSFYPWKHRMKPIMNTRMSVIWCIKTVLHTCYFDKTKIWLFYQSQLLCKIFHYTRTNDVIWLIILFLSSIARSIDFFVTIKYYLAINDNVTSLRNERPDWQVDNYRFLSTYKHALVRSYVLSLVNHR
jgi:hypothetical protein